MTSRTALVLACVILSVLSQHIVNFSGEVTKANPIYQIFQANLQGDATITVDHAHPVRLCIRQTWADSTFTFQNNTAAWNISCDFYYDFKPITPTPTPTPEPVTPTPTPEPVTPTPTPEPHTPTPTPEPETPTPTPEPVTPTPTPEPVTPTPTPEPVTPTPTPEPVTPTPTPEPETPTPTPEPATPTDTPVMKRSVLSLADVIQYVGGRAGLRYSVAIGLLPGEAEPTNVTVTLDGVTCDAGTTKIWDQAKKECIQPTAFKDAAEKVELDAGEVKYFQFTVPRLTGNFKLASTSPAVTFRVKFGGNPDYKPDVSAAAPSVDYPTPGTWFFAVTSNADVEFNITANLEDCAHLEKNNTAGPGCKVAYQVVSETNKYQMSISSATPGVWHYWKVVVNSTMPLWASARTDSGEDFPQLYASKDQLPTETSYDIKNCNFEYCDGANIIKLNVTHNETQTWWIGSTTFKPNNSYGVWFNTVCAPECVDQNTGTCTDTDPGYGICVCATSSLSGVDCTLRNGIPPEYIVLIIIAALVVASAIIGFVAWAYMRRKRVQYEQVTG